MRFGVEWNGTPLRALMERLPKSKMQWQIRGTRLERTEAALLGGIARLSEFDAMNAEDKTNLIAYARVRRNMTAWENYQAEQEQRQQNSMTVGARN